LSITISTDSQYKYLFKSRSLHLSATTAQTFNETGVQFLYNGSPNHFIWKFTSKINLVNWCFRATASCKQGSALIQGGPKRKPLPNDKHRIKSYYSML